MKKQEIDLAQHLRSTELILTVRLPRLWTTRTRLAAWLLGAANALAGWIVGFGTTRLKVEPEEHAEKD